MKISGEYISRERRSRFLSPVPFTCADLNTVLFALGVEEFVDLLAAARDTTPDTLSTAISDDTAADAGDEPSVLTGSSVTDLACPFSKLIERE